MTDKEKIKKLHTKIEKMKERYKKIAEECIRRAWNAGAEVQRWDGTPRTELQEEIHVRKREEHLANELTKYSIK